MDSNSNQDAMDDLVFMDEDESSSKDLVPDNFKKPWKILVVDDEEEVHEITKITLRDFLFEDRGLQLFSAYNESDVKSFLKKEPDIALILLDVVMEEDNTGLILVEHIRDKIKNSKVRIVLRTGQPGKAPEQEVISKYDINDYKTKPEYTAQKLFTSVTACLRAYKNLDIIEKNTDGLKSIIRSTAKVFKNQSFSKFCSSVLVEFLDILNLGSDASVDSAYLVGMPNSSVLLTAGTGRFADKVGTSIQECMSNKVISVYEKYVKTGGESLIGNQYTGIFKTKEGFNSILYLKGAEKFTSIEKNLIRIYANNIAIGFDNISLAREIINTQKEVILTLGEIVETRSKETAHHVTRVAECCYLLASKMGMDDEKCEMIRLASPMHDVGKIGIPEAILNKSGKLTEEEFKIVQTHSQTGYDILKNSNRSIMKAAAIIALQHHERFDGKGYPQGLLGENIHIFGRIAAIADVFDALSHKRCYKEAWQMDRIVALFQSERGKHFDKTLVDIFLSNSDEFVSINRRFPE